MPAPRPRFRPARQARSQRTLERILATARDLAREGGLDAVTVQEVTRRSGVTTGSFYARFAGRDALLHHMENRFWEEVEERWRRLLEPERWAGLGAGPSVALLVESAEESYRRDAPELRAYLLHALAHPERKPLRRVTALETGIAGRAAELLRPHFGGMRHPDPARAVAFATRELLGALRAEVLLWEADTAPEREHVDEERLVERIRAFLAYLGVQGSPEPEDALRAAAAAAR